ncbi:DUF2897 family protein [Bowmanella sp. JS7-9]|uniref:DUF2897 family protein n=1 Tax=Pseudobowmanella zhangzhouensis TaxID=1537679 RepID=A0ABW1XIT5_9ALTE|nr:DUF2897 family protein [Bowmanella sp. JS7-9]
MSGWIVGIIIFVVLGVIVGNLMLLKQTANNKYSKNEVPPGVKAQPYSDDDE